MNKGLHGATPTLAGTVAVVDMVRAIRKRRELALEAMMKVSYGDLCRKMRILCFNKKDWDCMFLEGEFRHG